MTRFADSWLGRVIFGSEFRKAVATLAGGTAFAHLITLLSYPAVTRFFGPEELGLILIFLSFTGFWSRLGSLRYESALLIADTGQLSGLARLSLGLIIVNSVLAGAALWGLMRFNLLGFGELPTWFLPWVIPIMLGLGLFELFRVWRVRETQFVSISQATVVRSATIAAVRIGSGLTGIGVVGLVVAELLGAVASAARLAGGWLNVMRPAAQDSQWGIARIAKRFSRFPKFELPSVSINMLALALPVPLVALNFGTAAAGIFGVAVRLVAIPNAQIGVAISDVFVNKLGEQVRARRMEPAKQLFNQLTRKLALLGLIPLVLVIALAPPLAEPILGKEWGEVGVVAALIAPWLYAAFIVSSLSKLLVVVERQDLKLIYDIIALLCVSIVFIGCHYLDFSFRQTVGILGGMYVVSYFIYYLLLRYALNHPHVASGETTT